MGSRFAIGTALLLAPSLCAQMTPAQTYVGVNRPAPVVVDLAEIPAGAPLDIALIEPDGQVLSRAAIQQTGQHDLATLFPLLWTDAEFPLVYAQLRVGGEHVGPPLVIQPLETPVRAEDGLTARVRDRDIPLRDLGALPDAKLDELGQELVVSADGTRVRSGLRMWVDQRIILETDAGEIELALRPDAAPNTTFHFLQLVAGGLYADMPFHRVIGADAQGRPFLIQTGDPTGTGLGGCGAAVDFEPSTLEHAFGVVSMARMPDDPNSASSQFFICLSREACAKLDGLFTSFAQVVRGENAIATIAATPTTANGRPIDPPMLLRAYAVDAPTIDERTIEAPPAPVQTEPGPR